MQKRYVRPKKRLIISSLLLTGMGIGWLVGLSVSPVVSIVITMVTGSAAAVIAALSGLEDKPDESKEANLQKASFLRWNIDPLPLMVLVVGILLGSLIGIKARNDGWLGTDLSIEVKKWTDEGLVDGSFTKADLVRRLFESHYYTNTKTIGTGPVQNNSLGTVLFNSDSPECQRLIGASTISRMKVDDTLANALRGSTVIQLRELPVVIADTLLLTEVVEKVICTDGSSQP
jgi:hypothetical protein